MFIALISALLVLGNLTASLAVTKPKWPFLSLRELAEAPDWPVYVMKDTLPHDRLQV